MVRMRRSLKKGTKSVLTSRDCLQFRLLCREEHQDFFSLSTISLSRSAFLRRQKSSFLPIRLIFDSFHSLFVCNNSSFIGSDLSLRKCYPHFFPKRAIFHHSGVCDNVISWQGQEGILFDFAAVRFHRI